MREWTRIWQPIVTMVTVVVVLLAFVAFPVTHAQPRIPGARIPGGPPISPGTTANAIMPITMEIVQSCVASASDLDFGVIASNSTTAALGQSAIELTCGVGVTAEIALDAGLTPGNRRAMIQEGGKGRLNYDLFQDAGRTVHWGDRSGRDTLEVLFEGTLRVVPIYGQIPAGQRALDGTYRDTITVTVTY
jgi:spore coat protein U-like protein